MQNKVHLIAYADRLGGMKISELHSFMQEIFPDLFAGIHLLPFFYPIDGADAGYDPSDNRIMDARLGTWKDISELAESFELMADLIVNHVSDLSKEFQDVLVKGSESAYFDMFLTKEKVFGNSPSEESIAEIFRPRPSPPFTSFKAQTGEQFNFWTTFSAHQIDIDIESKQAKDYLDSVLNVFHENGLNSIRLDAVGYAVKKAGSSCFMLPETYRFIEEMVLKANALGLDVLTEIHSHYQTQIDIARYTDYVYDFVLPPLLIFCLEKRDYYPLVEWLKIRPKNSITVLDTHDGIGVMDLGAAGDAPGFLSPEDINFLVEVMHSNTGGTSKLATGEAASNLDIYQINSTYFDALGSDTNKYLMARAIQFFCPGVPQVYYMGWLALPNDTELLRETGVGRDINRSYLRAEKIIEASNKDVVKDLMELIKFRNNHPAFEGIFSFKKQDNVLVMRWDLGEDFAQLELNFQQQSFYISNSRLP